MSYESQLRDALSGRGDLELRFQCRKSIRVHSQKMALASCILQALMDDIMDEQIASAKRRKIAEGDSGSSDHLSSLQVSPIAGQIATSSS